MTESYDLKVVNDDGWKIDCNGTEYGPYANRDIAMEAANAAAAKAISSGRNATVLVGPIS